MEREIGDYLPLVLCGLCLERAEPVVDPFLRQSPAALRREHIGSCCVAGRLQIRIERLASCVHQVDIMPLASLLVHVEPSLRWTHMGMRHLEPGDLTHPAARPVAQGEEGGPTLISCELDQRAQDRALCSREVLASRQWHGGKFDAPGGVASE